MRCIIKLMFAMLAFFTCAWCNAYNIECYNLPPMLDSLVMIPNGGTIRLFPWQTFKSENRKEYVSIFVECPYQETAPIIYNRYGWWSLEPQKDRYNFTDVIDPILKQAIKQHSRVIIGLASMCGEKSIMSHLYKGKLIATPDYLFEDLQNTKWAMHEDNQFGKGEKALSISYDSPMVYERFGKLLHAFRKWLDKKIPGTRLKRKDIIYGIEMRHLGYWGEGGIKWEDRPNTYLLVKYIDLYVKEFPDILLIGGINSTVHLPLYKGENLNDYTTEEKVMMRYNYKLMSASNKYGRIGGFIDSWMPNSNQFDSITQRVLLDNDGNIVHLREFLKNDYWGKIYLTGEFGYFIKDSNKEYYPYEKIRDLFQKRKASGISAHNVSAFYGYDSTGKKYHLGDKEYKNVKEGLSLLGYRIVLDSLRMEQIESKIQISYVLSNIGISWIFHKYNEMHILIKEDNGKVILDKLVPFDFTKISPIGNTPAEGKMNKGQLIRIKIPAQKGNICLIIKDKYNIEYPMTLSNYGRQKDGCYLLGRVS